MDSKIITDPMAECYNNPEYNRYLSADIPDNFQPGAANNSQFSQQLYKICLMNLPKTLNETGLNNLCSNYGDVVDCKIVRDGLAFVEFSKISEAESAVRKLNECCLKIRAAFAKPNQQKIQLKEQIQYLNPKNNNYYDTKKIDLNKRKYNLNPPPKIITDKFKPFINEKDYENNNLIHVDPYKEFLIKFSPYFYDLENIDDSLGKLLNKDVVFGRSVVIERTEQQEKSKQLSIAAKGEYDSIKKVYLFKSADDIAYPRVGICILCKGIADKYCERCRNSYCSVQCQKNDWPNHSRKCILPSSDDSGDSGDSSFSDRTEKNDLNNATSSSIILTEFPKNKSIVSITSFINSGICFIRKNDNNSYSDYFRILQDICEHSIKAPFLTKAPGVGDIVLADFQNTGYFRALILNVNNVNKIKLVYLDFGNYDVKCYTKLKLIKNGKLKRSKRFVHRCDLKDINESLSNAKVIDYLNTIITDGYDIKIVYDEPYIKNVTKCELIIIQNNESLNIKIMDLLTVKKPSLNEAVVMYEDLELKKLPTRENIDIYILDKTNLKDGIIWCTNEQGILELDDLKNKIQLYCQNIDDDPPYTPRLNEVCLVKYENIWSRGICIELFGDGNPTIFFLDFGNNYIINYTNIRKLPSEFSHQQIATRCCIADFPNEITDEYYNKLNDALKYNTKIIADKIECNKNESDDEFSTVIYLSSILNKIE